jgi:hypothetical protein
MMIHDFPGQTRRISPWISHGFYQFSRSFQVKTGIFQVPSSVANSLGYDLLCIEGLVRALQVFKGVTWWSQWSHGKPWEALVIP